MDSSLPPPPPSRSLYRLRPWYLVAAMALTWFAGVQGIMAGCADASVLRAGHLPDPGVAAPAVPGQLDAVGLFAFGRAAMLAAMAPHVRVMFPLAIAGAMLGGLLVIGSGLAMGGRRGGRSLALQAAVANALFAVLAYVLTRDVRAAWADAVAGVAGLPPHEIFRITRLKLVVDLVPLALGVLALTRPRTRRFFDAVERAAARAEDP